MFILCFSLVGWQTHPTRWQNYIG